jgi:putative transposase
MSRPGTPIDNAPMESFFGTLKTECLYRQRLASFEEAERMIKDYVHYYNYIRIRTKDKMTPYERRRRKSTDVQLFEKCV